MDPKRHPQTMGQAVGCTEQNTCLQRNRKGTEKGSTCAGKVNQTKEQRGNSKRSPRTQPFFGDAIDGCPKDQFLDPGAGECAQQSSEHR
jgi:hypothetical protein